MGTMKGLQDNLAPCLDEADQDKNFFKRIHNRSLRTLICTTREQQGFLPHAAKAFTRHRSVLEDWLSAVLSAEYTAKFDEAPQKSFVNWKDESNAPEKHCESDSSGDDDDGAIQGEQEAPLAPVFETVAQGRAKRQRKATMKAKDMVVQSSSSDEDDK